MGIVLSRSGAVSVIILTGGPGPQVVPRPRRSGGPQEFWFVLSEVIFVIFSYFLIVAITLEIPCFYDVSLLCSFH